tara:strand:- start:19680 stop:20327 length:648 start_codon:yes stop_codon:yes gene_type:complete
MVFFMLRDVVFCTIVGLAGGLFIAAGASVIKAVYPFASIWTAICVILLIATTTGFYLAGRVTSPDSQVAVRRAASVLLLAGFALTIVLVFLYALPIFRPTLIAEAADLVGPMIGLLFFPVLLIAMSARISVRNKNTGMFVSIATILGGISGIAISEFLILKLLSPSWPIAVAVLILSFTGIWFVRSGEVTARGQSMASMLCLVMNMMSIIFAAMI